jgi:hypothetical protein
MSGLFGEQVAEYAGDAAPSSVEEAVAAFDKRVEAREQVVVKPEVKEVDEVPPAPEEGGDEGVAFTWSAKCSRLQ